MLPPCSPRRTHEPARRISFTNADGTLTKLSEIGAKSDFVAQLGKNAINNTVRALIDTSINGGDLADKIGRGLFLGAVDASGAVGGLVGELAAEWYGGSRDPLNATEASKTVNIARLFGALVNTVIGGDAQVGADAAGNAAQNNFLNHKENHARLAAQKACSAGDEAGCQKAADLDVLDKQRDAEFHSACDGALRSSAGCAVMTRELYASLSTYAQTDARKAASADGMGDFTKADKEELQSYLDLIKTSNNDVKTSAVPEVRSPKEYDPDPYGVVDKNAVKETYLVMKFGSEGLAIANTRNGDQYWFTDLAARNGMDNKSGYAVGLMLSHVDAAARTKQDEINLKERTNTPYTPVDRYTLSYAPTNGFFFDVFGASLTKVGLESDSVLGLRSQMEYIQVSGQSVNWVTHSRGGAEFVQAASGSSATSLSNNSVVFHAGANNKSVTDFVIGEKKIGDLINQDNRYRDAPNDLVPQIVGLRFLSSPLNLVPALLSAPCLSDTFCSIQQSPHTIPYQWSGLKKEGD